MPDETGGNRAVGGVQSGSTPAAQPTPIREDEIEKKSSDRVHWVHHGSFWSQIALGLIGIVALVIYYCQLQTTRRALVVDERAWVGPKTFAILNLPLEANKLIKVGIDYWNFGKTPALNVSGFAQPELVVSTAKLDFSRWGEPLDSDRSVLFPGSSNHILRKFDALPEPVFSDFLNEKSFFYIYGNIGYEDVFGFHHWTHFCLRYSIPDAGFVYCETFNDVDKEQR
jgi:hypothetical protein